MVLDAICLKEHKSLKGSFPSWPWATSLDLFAQNTCQRSLVRYTVSANNQVTKDILFPSQCYFAGINPAVSTQPHRYIYMSIGAMGSQIAPPQGIARLDTETKEVVSWMPRDFEFCGEPMYAKSQTSNAEDGGYILSVVWTNTKESELVILRANDIGNGPVARVPLGVKVPHGLYGCYTDEGEFTFEEIERRAKLADKMESRGNMWNEVKSDFSGLGLRLDDFEEYFGDLM